MADTIIKVALTRTDEYGNLWVTPAGGGAEVKIGEKRKTLFPLFQQGNTLSLHWETYKDKPYVKDAKQIVGEPVPTKTNLETTPVPQQQGKSPETVAMEIDGKFRDTALMQACEMEKTRYEAEDITIEEVLVVADKCYAWLKGEKTVTKAPEKTAPAQPVQPAQQEAALPATMPTNPTLVEIEGLLKDVNWKPVTWRSWIKAQFKVDSTGELAMVLTRLDPNQTNMFTNHLKTMAETSGVK